MTHVIKAKNVNHAFADGFWWLKTSGVPEVSRNGPVLVAPGPVITEYESPKERVLFNSVRDANPVFHLMEALWMIAGSDDIHWLSQFNTNIKSYAEDDGTIHGAYGHRWRVHSGVDQISELVQKLAKDPDTRHGVLQMWDCKHDLLGAWRDRPCNTHIYFDTRKSADGIRRLNMTVLCRSNDMLWGAYGANVVHFSVLQEVMAVELGVEVGVYRQMSNNFHVYTDLPQVKEFLRSPPAVYDLYDYYGVKTLSILLSTETLESLTADCRALVLGHQNYPWRTKFMREVAEPLATAYLDRKMGEDWSVDHIPDCDWKVAFNDWVARR